MTIDRRWLLPALAAALLLLVAACGDDDDDAQPTPTSSPTAEATAEPTDAPTQEATSTPTEEATAEPTDEPSGETHDLAIVNFQHFDATIAVGDTVRWMNGDGFDHTSTGRNFEWDSGSMPAGSRFSHTFETAGSFEYYCTIHPSMIGTITVE